jgi:O-antigen/teichoic acid export membrane protein
MGHLYLPKQFGFYALVVNIAGIVALLLSKSLETFIVPARNDQESKSIFMAGVQIVVKNWAYLFVLSAASVLIFYATGKELPKNSIALYLSIVLGPLIALYSLCFQLILRNLKYRVLATRGPIQNSSIGASQWIIHHSSLQSVGLILGEILGRLVGLFFLLSNIRSLSMKMTKKTFRRRNLDRLNQPILVNFFSIVFDTAAAAALLIIVNLFFGDWASGQVSMAQRIVVLPIVFLGVNFAQYFLASGSHNHRVGNGLTRAEFDSALLKLFLLSLGIATILFLSGSWVLGIFLGDEWATAGKLIRFLLPSMVISLIWNPMSSYFYVRGLWMDFLKISSMRLLIICLGALVARLTKMNLYETTIFLSTVNGIIQLYGLYILRRFF